MILASITQKQILSFILLAVLILLIYLLIKFFKRNLKNDNESKMLSLNLVIKHSTFIKYLQYKDTIEEDYSLYMVSIDDFLELSNKYSNNIIKLYVRRFVKNLSIMLPYGGKLAQTKDRNTFVLYVPKVAGSEVEFAYMLKNAAIRPYVNKNIKILQNVSIGYSNSLNKYELKLKEAYYSVITSKRALGLITEYNDLIMKPDEKHVTLEREASLVNVDLIKYEVIRTNINKVEGLYLNVLINNKDFTNYLSEQPQLDKAWMNMNLISKMLTNLDLKITYNKIYLPVLLKVLEEDNFTEHLHVILQANNFSFNNVIISIKNSIITNRNNIIKNILQLKELGVLISFETKIIDQEIFNTIKSYGINTIELYFNSNNTNEKLIYELNNYAKVNQLNTLVISENEIEENLCTHHLKKISQVAINQVKQDEKKWSR